MTTLSATRSGVHVQIPNRDKSVPEAVPELSPTPDTSETATLLLPNREVEPCGGGPGARSWSAPSTF